MPKYIVTTELQFRLETEDIEAVLRDYEFPDFSDTPVIGEVEFVDGKNHYEPLEEGENDENR